MAKSRKKIFPKPPQRLTSKTSELLGKNSNKTCYEASVKAIYNNTPSKQNVLSPAQRQMLDNQRRNLSMTYQRLT